MAAAGEDVHDTMAETAEKMADLAGQAAADAAGAAGEMLGEEGVGEVAAESNAWSFWFRALMAIVVIVACFVASRVSVIYCFVDQGSVLTIDLFCDVSLMRQADRR